MTENLWSLLAGCAVGLVWGVLMTYSHSMTFAEYLCKNCRRRNFLIPCKHCVPGRTCPACIADRIKVPGARAAIKAWWKKYDASALGLSKTAWDELDDAIRADERAHLRAATPFVWVIVDADGDFTGDWNVIPDRLHALAKGLDASNYGCVPHRVIPLYSHSL